jgi:ABC-2 type transport system ATP-binding protein
MDKIIIETKNLSKVYTTPFTRQGVKALDNLNIQVNSGEIFGFLGPNGSGKTTTMKILLGLISPTQGRAWVLGKQPTDVAVKDRIGFLPEESYLYRFLSADETLDFYGRIFKIPKIERKKRIDKLIDIVGLGNARKRQVKEYSKGMARRLGLAQALINNPDVIFLDEPTSGLDPIVARQVKDLILDLKNEGKTIFMSSHLLSDVEDVCDRIAILHLGRLQKIGKVQELISNPEITEVSIKGLNNNLKVALKELVEKNNGQMIDIHPASETLETLFLKTIHSDKKEN